jgi:glutamate dehydrogenase
MVLRNNYTQSLCLSLDHLRCMRDVDPYIDVSERLVNAGLLDLQGEFLPGRKELLAREQGYVRSELAILMGYSKMHLFDALLNSDLPDQAAAQSILREYFPELIGRRYGRHIGQHPLHREIIATMITNQVVDHAGCAFLNNLTRQTGATMAHGVKAYLVFDQVLDGSGIRSQVFAADNKLSCDRQYEILLQLEDALSGLCAQAVELGLAVDLDPGCVDGYRDKLDQHCNHLKTLLSPGEWRICADDEKKLRNDGFDKESAERLSRLHNIGSFLPAVHIATATGSSLFDVIDVLNGLQVRLHFNYLLDVLAGLTTRNRWERMAQTTLRGDFRQQLVALARNVVEKGQTPEVYLAERRRRFDYYLEMVNGLRSTGSPVTSVFTVLLHAMEGLK